MDGRAVYADGDVGDMNHEAYNKYIMSKVKKTIPKDDYKKIVDIVNRIAKGNRKWELEDLAIQQEYPEEIEELLLKKYKKLWKW